MSFRRAEFFERVARWSARTHLSPTQVRFRHMKRFWAVCNVDNSITFAVALLDQPAEFQDLVIVHELVHLLIRDHGPHFKTLLGPMALTLAMRRIGKVSESLDLSLRDLSWHLEPLERFWSSFSGTWLDTTWTVTDALLRDKPEQQRETARCIGTA